MSRIYPRLEEHAMEGRRPPAMGHRRQSSLETQCEQILQRAPTVTKDLLDRMQNAHIGKTHICGYEFKTKQLWVLAGLFFLFAFSSAATILLWFTNAFDSFVLSNLIIANNSDAFKVWSHPSVKTTFKVHIFNYTNIAEFERGLAEKLHVQDVGPYVYEETKERVNVRFNGNGTVSYQESRSYRFLPKLSKGRQSDRVIVPNLMVMAAADRTQDAFFLTKWAASFTLDGMQKKPFMKLAAHRFIWGYDDSVYQLARGFMAMQNPSIPEQAGLLAHRNGTSPNVVTINTGENGIDQLGMINKFNGEERMGRWSTDECDRITASDGTMFPPKSIREKQPVEVYLNDVCRKLPYSYQKETKLINGTVPVYRYVVPEDVFASADHDPVNQCFCNMDSGVCPPHGFLNASSCALGSPIYISLPHFYKVDPSYIKVTGLNPKPQEYVNYMDIHPLMGFPIAGKSRLQVNILAKKSFGFFSMDMFNDDDVMLPLAWFDSGIEDKGLPQEAIEVIYKATFTVRGVELTAKYGSFLTCLVTLTAMLIIARAKWQEHVRKLNRNSSVQRRLVV